MAIPHLAKNWHKKTANETAEAQAYRPHWKKERSQSFVQELAALLSSSTMEGTGDAQNLRV